MKRKYIFLVLAIGFTIFASGQVTTEPAEDIDPTQPLKIIVDISQLDASKDYVQNLQTAAAAGEDLYFWTWLPYEFPAGHPKANGTGATPWKSSNELLKMTMEDVNIYSYTLTPTDFYEVDAATVYENDIHFLVKPKDGGGFGDPDFKSDDLTVAIDPPKLERDPAYAFPEAGQIDDVYTIYYENARESKPSMKDLSPGEVYLFAQATLSDSSLVFIEPSFFSVGSNPQLEMDYIGDDTFRKFIYPRDFFTVPQGQSVSSMKFVVIRKVYASSADRTDGEIEITIGCP